jgi:hypothetical protein
MPELSHRLQLLLDEQRYQRVAAEARARGVSVARVIRDAIDRSLAPAHDRRAAALRTILTAEPMPVPDNPADLRAELDEIRGARFS